jgi:uncharacterized membrane protein
MVRKMLVAATMKTASLIGVLLIVLGLGALAYRGFTYTTRDKVVDLGPIEASKETTHSVPIPPAVAGIAIVSGVVLVIAGTRRA